jgi:diketogulonate reductase-like aldo/keto reductase
MSISRRDFTAALGAVSAPLISAGMPMRQLGSTGARLPAGRRWRRRRFVSYGEGPGIAALNHALDLGITYIDTADVVVPTAEPVVGRQSVKQRGRAGLWLPARSARAVHDFMRMRMSA